ncbi:MAG: hypothetical protein JW874_16645 [Spirochaetales bacterium]|nr:hypothetical protein [Spirochaetales bacterium]
MKKLLIILAVLAVLSACSTMDSLIPKQRIEVSIPKDLGNPGAIRISTINFVREGVLSLKDQDEIWFEETELPAMLTVLGEKSGLDIICDPEAQIEPGTDGLLMDIELHEMKKEGTLPKKNAITIICILKNNSSEKTGRIVFVDVSANSILNSHYSYAVFSKIVKKLAGALK